MCVSVCVPDQRCACVRMCVRQRELRRGEERETDPRVVVISQTHFLVSQVRLPPTVGTALFILYTVVPSVQWWF